MSTARRFFHAAVAGALMSAAAASALAQAGLRVGDTTTWQQSVWPRWQARLGWTPSATVTDVGARWQLGTGHLVGDYYWSELRLGRSGSVGGFRATSGLLLGHGSLAQGAPALAAGQAASLGPPRNARLAHPMVVGDGVAESWAAVPYIGIGYSGASLRGGWGFTADVGLAGSAGGLRPKRDGVLGNQGLDDLVRELRLRPVLQFGASYAF